MNKSMVEHFFVCDNCGKRKSHALDKYPHKWSMFIKNYNGGTEKKEICDICTEKIEDIVNSERFMVVPKGRS